MTSSSGSSGGGSGSGSSGSGRAPKPREAYEAPAGAYLGDRTSSTGVSESLVSSGNGTGTGSRSGETVSLGGASSPYSGSSIASGGGTPQSISQGGGGGGGPVGTTVNQTPAAGDGPEGTTITATPRSDYSVVLAGQVGNRPNRSPSRSNNFVSLVGGAGGLGRATNESKRTLIGGA